MNDKGFSYDFITVSWKDIKFKNGYVTVKDVQYERKYSKDYLNDLKPFFELKTADTLQFPKQYYTDFKGIVNISYNIDFLDALIPDLVEVWKEEVVKTGFESLTDNENDAPELAEAVGSDLSDPEIMFQSFL